MVRSPARCDLRCDDDAVLRDGRCQPLPLARPVAPPNGARVYSRAVQLCATGGLGAPAMQQRFEVLDARTGAVLHTRTVDTACAEVPGGLCAVGQTLAWRVRSVAGAAVSAPSVVWRVRCFPRADDGSLERGVTSFDGAAPGSLAIGTRTGAIALVTGAPDLRARPAAGTLPSPEAVTADRSLTLLDLQGDGRAALVVGGPATDTLRLWRAPTMNSTPEALLRAPASLGAAPGFGALLTVGRFSDGLGDDLAVASVRSDRVVVFTGLAGTLRTTLLPVSAAPVALAAGAVMGGAYDDLVVATRERMMVFRTAPEGVRTSPTVNLPWQSPPVALDVADVVADGLADIVVRDGAALRVYRGSLDGVVGPVQTIAVGAGAMLQCADLTGDGVADCAIVVGSELRVHRGGPGGLSLTPTAVRSVVGIDQGAPAALVLRDLDGNGFVDATLLSRSAEEGTLLVYAGARGGLANEPVVIHVDLKDDVLVGPAR